MYIYIYIYVHIYIYIVIGILCVYRTDWGAVYTENQWTWKSKYFGHPNPYFHKKPMAIHKCDDFHLSPDVKCSFGVHCNAYIHISRQTQHVYPHTYRMNLGVSFLTSGFFTLASTGVAACCSPISNSSGFRSCYPHLYADYHSVPIQPHRIDICSMDPDLRFSHI